MVRFFEEGVLLKEGHLQICKQHFFRTANWKAKLSCNFDFYLYTALDSDSGQRETSLKWQNYLRYPISRLVSFKIYFFPVIHLLIEMNYIRDRVTVNVHGFALSWPKNDVPGKINLDLIHIQEKSESYNKTETNFLKTQNRCIQWPCVCTTLSDLFNFREKKITINH